MSQTTTPPFWLSFLYALGPRYYHFNVWSELKCKEKLRHIHRNPVKRGLVARRFGFASQS